MNLIVGVDETKQMFVDTFKDFNTQMVADPDSPKVTNIYDIKVVDDSEYKNLNLEDEFNIDGSEKKVIINFFSHTLNVDTSDTFKAFDRVLIVDLLAHGDSYEELKALFEQFTAYVNMKQPNKKDETGLWAIHSDYSGFDLQQKSIENGRRLVQIGLVAAQLYTFAGVAMRDSSLFINDIEVPMIQLDYAGANENAAFSFVGNTQTVNKTVRKTNAISLKTVLRERGSPFGDLLGEMVDDFGQPLKLGSIYSLKLDIGTGSLIEYDMVIDNLDVSLRLGMFTDISVTFSVSKDAREV